MQRKSTVLKLNTAKLKAVLRSLDIVQNAVYNLFTLKIKVCIIKNRIIAENTESIELTKTVQCTHKNSKY